MDLSIDGRLGWGVIWQVAGYDREDRGLVELPGLGFRAVNGALVRPSSTSRYQNALDGHSRGIDLFAQRTTLNGLSGWLAYSLSYTKYHDRASGETFWGDWDQRHTVNAYAAYRFNDRYSASTRFRYGSNFPAVGYWQENGAQREATDDLLGKQLLDVEDGLVVEIESVRVRRRGGEMRKAL